MNVISVPPIHLSPISDTDLSWRWLDGQVPVDFTQTVDGTAWTAEFLLLCRREVQFRAAVDLSVDGYLTVSVPQEVSERARCWPSPSYQITITSPYPTIVEVWSGPVAIHEVQA